MSTFLLSLKVCLKDKFLLTGGRASRAEYWNFAVVALVVFVVVATVINLNPTIGMVLNVLNFLLFIALYTATIRRLHDSNRSNKHLLPILAGMIMLIVGIFTIQPMVKLSGEILLVLSVLYVLVLCLLPGTQGDNNYGPPSPLKAP